MIYIHTNDGDFDVSDFAAEDFSVGTEAVVYIPRTYRDD